MVYYRKQGALITVQVTVVPWLLGHFIRFTYAVLVEETGKICTVNESVEAASGIIYMLFMHNKFIFSLCQCSIYCNKLCVSLQSEFRRAPQVLNYIGTKVTLRQGDGSLVYSSVLPFPALLHEYSISARWEDALRLCCYAKVRYCKCLLLFSTCVSDFYMCLM